MVTFWRCDFQVLVTVFSVIPTKSRLDMEMTHFASCHLCWASLQTASKLCCLYLCHSSLLLGAVLTASVFVIFPDIPYLIWSFSVRSSRLWSNILSWPRIHHSSHLNLVNPKWCFYIGMKCFFIIGIVTKRFIIISVCISLIISEIVHLGVCLLLLGFPPL